MAQTEVSIYDRIRSKPPIDKTGQHAATVYKVDMESQASNAPAENAGVMADWEKYTTPSTEVVTQEQTPLSARAVTATSHDDVGMDVMSDWEKYTLPSTETSSSTTTGETVAPTEMPAGKALTIANLYEDETAQKIMRTYFRDTMGESVEGLSNKAVADKYVNRMRMWTAGNSMTVVNELYTLTMGTDKSKNSALQAYDLWDKTASIFDDEATWGDTFDGLYDYAYAALIDPTNVAALAGGSGIAARIGTKGAAVTAQVAAKAAAKMATDKAIATGVKAAAARTIGEKVFDDTLRKAMTSVAMKTALKKEAITKGAATLGIDTALTFGVDYAYQQGLITSGKQKEYSAMQGGIVALGVLGGNALSFAASKGASYAAKALAKETAETTVVNGVTTTTTKSFMPQDVGTALRAAKEAAVSTPKEAAKVAAEKMTVNLDFALKSIIEKPLQLSESWAKKVAKGNTKMAIDQTVDMGTDDAFFKYLIMGDKKRGVVGLAESLLSSGVRIPQKKSFDDGITDFATDVILNLPDEYAVKMAKSFRDTLGKKSPQYNIHTKEDLSNLMAAKLSAAGRSMSVMAQWRKLNNSYVEDLTTDSMLDGLVPKGPTLMGKTFDKFRFLHNLFLRTVTAHPATALLNAKGHLAVAAMSDFSDVIRTGIHYGLGFVYESHKEQAKAIAKNLKFRYTTYLDPKTTVETFNSWLTEHADIQEKMNRFMVSGADYVGTDEAFKKQFGFSLKDSPVMGALDKYSNAAQVVWLGKAIDNVTKAVSFIPSLDKQLRLKFGSDMGFMKFYSQEGSELLKKTSTQDYLDVVSMAYKDAQRETLSLAAEKNTVGSFIEGISRYPFVGTIFPFGRFFNNTVRVMSDFTGVGAIGHVLGRMANGAAKAMGKGAVVDLGDRSTTEMISRAAVGLSAIYTVAQQYETNLLAGLSYNEEFDSQGNILNREYEYPENFLRYAGALWYYAWSDKEMPPELSLGAEGWKKFGLGSLTRAISDEERGVIGSVEEFLNAFTDPEGQPLIQSANMVYNALFVNYATALTRPLDPINHAAAIYRGDEYSAPDRKQGYEPINNTLRYTDQIFAVLSEVVTGKAIDIAPPKHVATREDIPLSPLQILSERILPPRSNTEKMFKKIGKPLYETNTKSYIPEASDALNKKIVPFLEARMALLDTKEFDKLPLDRQTGLVNNALEKAKEDALEAMRGSLIVEDSRMATLFDLSKKLKKPAVQKVLNTFRDEIGEGGIYDLSEAQLDTLMYRIKLEEKRINAP